MKKIFGFIFIFLASTCVQATGNWKVNLTSEKAFIKNEGQLDLIPTMQGFGLYAIQNGGEHIIFGKNGIRYVYLLPGKENKHPIFAFRKAEKEKENEVEIRTEILNMTWLNSNPDVRVTAEELLTELYLYRNPSVPDAFRCKAYKKITYHDLYPGIDVEYIIHKEGGFKYTLLVHPGADLSQVKMRYKGHEKLRSDLEGGVLITAASGTIRDKAPITWTANDKQVVSSAFVISGNELSFKIGNYDKNQVLVIDPWTISPGFTTFNKGYDVVRNSSTGEIFVYGGQPPYELKKFTSTGILIWTYVASLFYNSLYTSFYGDLAIDPAGDIYLADGCCNPSDLVKISGSTASIIWTNSVGHENWRMVFDTVNNVLIVAGYVDGGTGANVMTVNPTTGSFINSAVIIAAGTAAEVRGLASNSSGEIIMLHVSSYGTPDTNTNRLSLNSSALVNQYDVMSGFSLAEKGAYYAHAQVGISECTTPYCFHGINGIAISGPFSYTYDGATLIKRDLATGAFIASVLVPGGLAEAVSGVNTDSCGNIFVGTTNAVLQFDANLVQIGSVTTSGEVYDVIVANGGEIISCGSGFLRSDFFAINCSTLSAFVTTTSSNCPNICDGTATVNILTGTPPFTFVWSNSETTQSVSGLCPGTYSVAVSDSSGNTINILGTVYSVAPTTLNTTVQPTPCGASLGTALVSATGNAPFNYLWTPGGAITPGINNLSPGTYYVAVEDSLGCFNYDTVTINEGPPPSITGNYDDYIFCYGDCSGELSATTVQGTAPYTYLWSNGGTTSSISALCAQSYSVVVSDAYGCKDTTAFVLTQPEEIILSTSFIHCSDDLSNGQAQVFASGGTPSYNYAWALSPVQNNDTAFALASGIYSVTVTDINNCTKTTTVTIPECPPDSVFIPNVFSPNGDGTNDNFFIYSAGYNFIHCSIYNRWGQKIYEYEGVDEKWNGTSKGDIVPDGVYYYLVELTRYDGEQSERQGFIHLMR